ncbi:hypothetical protein SAMN04489746_0242 [Atopobium minutum]|uniref:Uncharacterized protein n=1 Tax=Atopobium minutum TaxID=1381 RepID=A0AB38A4W5_9ACTN|nr:hypothetical protein SAMN04489746_0242 [Atopobium minutum]
MTYTKKSARNHHSRSAQYPKGKYSLPLYKQDDFKLGFFAGAAFSFVLIYAFVFLCLVPVMQQMAGI